MGNMIDVSWKGVIWSVGNGGETYVFWRLHSEMGEPLHGDIFSSAQLFLFSNILNPISTGISNDRC